MAEATAVQESSTAPIMEVNRGPLVNLTPEQRTKFRTTGELPELAKVEAPPASEVKQESRAGESGTPERQAQQQAKPKKTAEERIAELEATIEKIRKGAEAKRQPSPEPKPQAKAPEQYTRPKPTTEDKTADGKPKYETYDDYIEDLADWKAEQREAKSAREREERKLSEAFQSKIEEARKRYPNLDEVVQPAVDSILADKAIPPAVKEVLNESDVLPDLLFTIASDEAEMQKFMEMARKTPGKAIRFIALTESLIAEELTKAAKPAAEPVKPKTSAPKPPAEVGGSSGTPPDPLEAAAKANDFRAFKMEATRRQLAKMK